MPRRMTRALATAAATAAVGWAAVTGSPLATAQDPYTAEFEAGEIPPSEGEPLDTAGEFGYGGGFGPGMTPGMMTPGMTGPGMMHPGMMNPGMMHPGMMGPGMGGGHPGGPGSQRQTSRLRATLSVLGRPASGIPGYYNWMRPVRRPLYRTPVTYQKYWPRHYYTGGPSHSPAEAAPRLPVVYQPTDTTQLGVTWQHVPTWQPDPYMVPPTPWPWDWHHHVPAQVYREHGRNGVVGAGYHPHPAGGHGAYGAAAQGMGGYGAAGYGMAGSGMNGFGAPSGFDENAGGFSGGLDDGQPAGVEPQVFDVN